MRIATSDDVHAQAQHSHSYITLQKIFDIYKIFLMCDFISLFVESENRNGHGGCSVAILRCLAAHSQGGVNQDRLAAPSWTTGPTQPLRIEGCRSSRGYWGCYGYGYGAGTAAATVGTGYP
jgi:hypothetical protein